MNKHELEKYNRLIVEKYDVSRFVESNPIDCVMPGFFGGNDVMFIAQNPGQLKETVEGDRLYLEAYEKKEYDKLEEHYIKALKSSKGTYGTFINDIYGEDWSKISITNVFKCPFVNNEIPDIVPEREKKILRKQIEFVNPKVLVIVGTVAWKFYVKNRQSITAKLLHTSHPAYLKRTNTYSDEIQKARTKLLDMLSEH